jgi:DNA polymerase V
MLSDFYDNDTYQPGLFDEVIKRPNSTKLMAVLDKINQSGLGRVFLASEGINNTWSMKRDHLSPAYTTRWSDIPTVR